MITQEHIDAMQTVIGHWPFPNMFRRSCLNEIHAHLKAHTEDMLETALVVALPCSGWDETYPDLDMTGYEADQ